MSQEVLARVVASPSGGGGGGGYSRFQVTGMIKGFFGFEIFDFRFFLAVKIWQVFLWGGLFYVGIFGGIKKESEDLWQRPHIPAV